MKKRGISLCLGSLMRKGSFVQFTEQAFWSISCYRQIIWLYVKLQHKVFRCYIKSIQRFLKRNIHFNVFISLVTKKGKRSMYSKRERTHSRVVTYCSIAVTAGKIVVIFKKSFLHDLLLCELIRKYVLSAHATHKEYLLPIWSLEGSDIRISMVSSWETKKQLSECCKTVTFASCLCIKWA